MARFNAPLRSSSIVLALALVGCDEEPPEGGDTTSASVGMTDGSSSSSTGGGAGTTGGSSSGTSSSSSSSSLGGESSSSGSSSTGGESSSSSSSDGGESSSSSGGDEPNDPFLYQFGTPAEENALALAVDSQGDALVGGSTQGDFLGGPPPTPFQAFVHKVGPDGTPLWFDQFLSGAVVHGLAVDSSDNVVAVGTVGGANGFVRKLDPDGNLLWFILFEDMGADIDVAEAVAIDGEDNIIVVGQDNADAVVHKFPPQGADAMTAPAPLFTALLGVDNGALDRLTAVAVDDLDNIHVAGRTSGSFAALNAGFDDAFMTVFDPGLDEDATRRAQWGGTANDTATGIAVDDAGDTYVIGTNETVISFMGLVFQEDDGFVAKFGEAGELWMDAFESSVDVGDEVIEDRPAGVILDDTGELLVVGVAGGLTGDINLVGPEIFERRYDPGDGTVLSTLEWGTIVQDGAEAVALGPDGPVLVGYTWGDLEMPDIQVGNRNGFVDFQ